MSSQCQVDGGLDYGGWDESVYTISPYSTGNVWKHYYSVGGNNLMLAIKNAEESEPVNHNAIAQYQEFTLRFRDCSWELVERKTQEQLAKETIPDVLFRLVDFMRDKEEWAGTATELLAAMGETETVPTVITKWLNEYRTTFLSENRICYQYSRRKDGRRIALARRAGDSGDGGDSDIRIPPCYCH